MNTAFVESEVIRVRGILMKRKFRLFLWMLCLSICLIPLISCSGNGGENPGSAESESTDGQEPTLEPGPVEPPKPVEPQGENYLLSDVADQVRLLGRCAVADGAVTCDFTVSGFEVNVNATGSMTLTLDATAQTYFTVFVDGKRQEKRLSVSAGENMQVELASFAQPGSHHIRVLKQTEAQKSLCLLKSLTFQGDLLERPADREWLIEFIGDGISCGYSNYHCIDGTPGAESADYQDGTIAYPFLTAKALNADCSVIGFGGMGLTAGTAGYNAADVYSKRSYLRSQTEDYDFARKPNLIVIDLGTNDALCLSQTTKEEVKTAVKELIATVRALNGEYIPIVWSYNMMNNGCADWIKDAIKELGGEDNRLFMCELTRNNDAGDAHPSEYAHQSSADKLAAFIRDKKLLKLTGNIPRLPQWENDLPIIWL